MTVYAVLKGKGLVPKSEILSNRIKSLNSMKMSSTYVVLLVGSRVMLLSLTITGRQVADTYRDFFVLLKNMQRLIAKTFWLPAKHADGEEPLSFMSSKSHKNHTVGPRKVANDCVCSVDRLKRKLSLSKFDPGESSRVQAAARMLDKPDLHRITD